MLEKIIIGSDHGGYNLKNQIIEHFTKMGYAFDDRGCFSTESCDYPVIAKDVVKEVLKTSGRGILVCGTGIGMSMVANRFDGIRASLCSDTYSARLTRMHNDSNILCLGERVLGVGLALDIVSAWLNTEFEGGRHKRRIDMIKAE
ncbi:MAG: ribose 5-phosphate isomerase B [bacterium]|nr:ribose 5-phosphate isomerase B [bacterium]